MTRHKPFRELRLAAQVHRAQSLARQQVVDGIGDLDGQEASELATLLDHLSGHEGPLSTDDEAVQIDKLTDHQQAAYALGLATGLLLRPDVFKKGDVR